MSCIIKMKAREKFFRAFLYFIFSKCQNMMVLIFKISIFEKKNLIKSELQSTYQNDKNINI